jgi:hypothetical protein
MNTTSITNPTTRHTQATGYQSGQRSLASLAASAVLTLAMLAGVNTLAVVDAAAPQMAQAASTKV